jgi:hypothetical protein
MRALLSGKRRHQYKGFTGLLPTRKTSTDSQNANPGQSGKKSLDFKNVFSKPRFGASTKPPQVTTSNGLTIPIARIKPCKKTRRLMGRRQPMLRSCELEKLRQGPAIQTADEHS